MALDLPWRLRFSGAVFHPANTSRTGGRSITGSMQVVQSNAGYWRATISVPVHDEELTLAYRAFVTQVQGMAGEVLVPCATKWRPYDRDAIMLPLDEAVAFRTAGIWDHSGFGQTDVTTVWVDDVVSAGAVEMSLRHPGAEGLRPGHYFGIGERLYMVTSSARTEVEVALPPSAELTFGAESLTFGGEPITYGSLELPRPVTIGVNRSVITFWPRLRETARRNMPLILGRPVCRMRLASDDSGVLDQGLGILGEAQLEFEEII